MYGLFLLLSPLLTLLLLLYYYFLLTSMYALRALCVCECVRYFFASSQCRE